VVDGGDLLGVAAVSRFGSGPPCALCAPLVRVNVIHYLAARTELPARPAKLKCRLGRRSWITGSAGEA